MRKWLSSVAMATACLISLTACGATTGTNNAVKNTTGSTTKQDLYQHIKATGVIRIGTEGTYAPFDFHDKSGQLTGFDVDIATEVAKKIGVKPNFLEAQWDGMFAGLNANRFDMIADEVSIRPDRQKKYDFSNPYIVSKAVLIVRKDNTTIHSFKDLKGKKAGQSLTSNLADIARSNGAQIVSTQGFNEAISLLESGRIDATVNDGLSFLDLVKHTPNVPLKIVDTYPNASKNGFMFKKGNQDLIDAVNKALAAMMKDGTYLKISQKYFGADVSK